MIDWPALLADIAYRLGDLAEEGYLRVPLSQPRLAIALKVPRGTLRGWLDGSEPRHRDGEMLLSTWCRLSGRARDLAPTSERVS